MSGDEEHLNSGFAVILTDGPGGNKIMNVGKNLANSVLYDNTGNISEPVYKELVEVTHGDIDMSKMSIADKFAYFSKNKKTVPTNIIDMYDTAKSSPHSKNHINDFLKYANIFNS